VNREAYRRIATLLAAIIVVLGFALLMQTARHGGGTAGFVIGALFVALGFGRLYLLRKRG
jgi:lipopolysaccharide export LptBFGC system permease protein LptF